MTVPFFNNHLLHRKKLYKSEIIKCNVHPNEHWESLLSKTKTHERLKLESFLFKQNTEVSLHVFGKATFHTQQTNNYYYSDMEAINKLNRSCDCVITKTIYKRQFCRKNAYTCVPCMLRRKTFSFNLFCAFLTVFFYSDRWHSPLFPTDFLSQKSSWKAQHERSPTFPSWVFIMRCRINMDGFVFKFGRKILLEGGMILFLVVTDQKRTVYL